MSAQRLLALLVVLALAPALAGCGRSESQQRKLIAKSQSEEVQATLDRIDRALESGACDRANDAVGTLREQVNGFRSSYDGKLVANVNQWVDHVEAQVPKDCVDAKPEKTRTPEPDETPEETQTAEPTQTPDATTTPAPTATATPAPTTTPDSSGQGGGGGSGSGVTGGAQPEEFESP